jgi:dethiobiotin synthetase
MSERFIVTGTDTDVGKTVLAAALAAAFDGYYWKPIQCGLENGGDRETVRRLSGLAEDRILPEAYRLRTPASPHRAAEFDGVEIDTERLSPPVVPRPLIIEGAGGLMVPLTRKTLQIDVFAGWAIPVVLCARTALGTINHTLLSLEALGRRGVSVLGIAFIGDENADTQRTIVEMSGIRALGRLGRVAPLERAQLAAAFAAGFSLGDFRR